MWVYILIICFAFLSEILWTIAWFWSSSILLPILSNFLDFKNALLLVAIYHIFGNGSRLLMFYKHINKKILLIFGIPSILLTVFWAMLVEHIDQTILKFILWVVLVSFATFSLIKPEFKVKVNNYLWIIWWWLSGFTAWLIWTGGVLRWAFMTLFQLPKEQYIATIATVALIVDFTRIPIYFWNGFLDKKFYFLIPLLFITALFWSYIWKKIVKLIPEEVFRKIILILVILLSSIFIYQWIIYIF